jgi:hypothetical protein
VVLPKQQLGTTTHTLVMLHRDPEGPEDPKIRRSEMEL